jgi:hypothetical protein
MIFIRRVGGSGVDGERRRSRCATGSWIVSWRTMKKMIGALIERQ